MTTEYEIVKSALLKSLMQMPPHAPITFRGRQTTASAAVQAMLKGESAGIDLPQQERSGAALRPTEEALANLTPEARATLERGEGIAGLTASHKPTISTRQDDGSHGTTRVSFHFTDEGNVEPGMPTAPTEAEQREKSMQESTVNRMRWNLLDR
jgi:hypothetical protein